MVSTEFSVGTDVDVEQNFVEMAEIKLPDDDPVYNVGANFVLFVTNWLRNSGKMKGYPHDFWTVRIWTVKFPGDIWIVENWTVKTGLGLRLGLGILLGLDLGLGLVLGFELMLLLLLVFRLGLGLVMTVQFMTVQIKTGDHGTAAPHFLAHVYCHQTAGWINMPFGICLLYTSPSPRD